MTGSASVLQQRVKKSEGWNVPLLICLFTEIGLLLLNHYVKSVRVFLTGGLFKAPHVYR